MSGSEATFLEALLELVLGAWDVWDGEQRTFGGSLMGQKGGLICELLENRVKINIQNIWKGRLWHTVRK